MDPLHARYPFLDAARDAVQRRELDVEELVAGRSAALGRAIERVESALSAGTVGQPNRDREVELLSYPLARILVSLVDDHRVTERFVTAEARTASDRFAADLERPEGGAALDLEAVDGEFDLDLREVDGGYSVDAVRYLALAVELEGERWRLVNRPLDDGRLPLSDGEIPRLLEAAVRRRVGQDLPLAVPPAIGDHLGPVIDDLGRDLGTTALPGPFDTVEPAAFPPCMQALIERIEAGEDLPPTSTYAIATFLTSVGLAAEDVGSVVEGDIPSSLVDVAAVVEGAEGPTQLPTGSCDTMEAYGDCIEPDEVCDRIDHPLEYYAKRLDEAT